MTDGKKKIILDTDPGSDFDDVFAITLAANSPEIDLLGVTIISGKGELRARIALKLLNMLGRADVPVIVGAEEPLMRKPMPWWTTFKPWGHEGVGFLTPEDDKLKPTPGHAADFIIEKVMQYPGEVTLVPIGPLTNIGLAITKEPKIIGKVKEIVAMGGVVWPEKFEISPKLEHNFSSDPHATQLVFESGIPFTMVGLNATLQVVMTKERYAQLRAVNTAVTNALVDMTDRWFEILNREWSELHDPVAVAAVIDRSFVQTKKYYIDLKMEDGILLTKPVARVDFIPAQPPHVDVCIGADGDRVWSFLLERLSKK